MKKRLISIALASALASASSNAEIQLSGYGSIVGGMTTSSDESLNGYNDNFDFKEGSLFALQATSDLDNGLGVTVQLQAKGSDDWDPEFKWAYVSYDATDSLRFLAGRQRVPFFMYSDFLDVSYAYAWIAPPTGLYEDAVFDTFDGLGAVYTTNFGDVDATFHGVFGRNTDTFEIDGNAVPPEFNQLAGLSTTFVYDWLTLRAAYFVTEMTLPVEAFDGLATAWDAVGYTDIANHTRVEEDDVDFLELGFQVNIDNVIVVGEYTKVDIDNTPFSNDESYYIMAGYQFDQVLVHLTYGADEGEAENYTSDAPYGILIPPTDFDLKAVTEQALAGQKSETSYITAGVRYDFHDSAALKFEYTAYSDDLDSASDAGLFRVALVTVF